MITSQKEVKERLKKALPNIDAIWLHNPAKSGMIFSEKHPYFDVPLKYTKLALKNFNLPIPKKD